MLKKQNGITLVALVITIIVLLILAGVTLSMVVGDNGILTRAKQSNFNTEEARVKEQVELAIADLSTQIEYDLSISSTGDTGYTPGQLAAILKKDLGDNISTEYNADDGSSMDDGKYVVVFGNAAADPSKVSSEGTATDTTTGEKVFTSSSNGNQFITVYYYSAKLKNSATKDWKGPLKYTFKVSAGYKIESINASADVNKGGY